MLKENDILQLERLGISQATLEAQLHSYIGGFPIIEVDAAASIGCGIKSYTQLEIDRYVENWDAHYNVGGEKVVKFVPASGAATRMFKPLYEYLQSKDDILIRDFVDHIEDFAFFAVLDAKCDELYGERIKALLDRGEYELVVRALIEKEGLSYGSLPKGLLLFHEYCDEPRTPFMEHMYEASLYAKGIDNSVELYFTVSPEHVYNFQEHLRSIISKFEEKNGVIYKVNFSTQKASTNTVAVNIDNRLYRDGNGEMLFRPGGHGALIENLNAIEADIIFVKNIDNVATECHIEDTVKYKKLIGGVLLEKRNEVGEYIRRLEERVDTELIDEISRYLENEFCVRLGDILGEARLEELALEYRRLLNRPIRVCGMVQNEGEPGGGPYIVRDERGRTSLQILESSQIDARYSDKMHIATHFNPVDLVCSVRDYEKNKFNLTEYVDKNTGFISEKTIEGTRIKVLELPGLWNGAMSDWLTIFVEVPITTFNPVKTVNDLLRVSHR